MPYKPTNQTLSIVETGANELVAAHLKPTYIKPAPSEPRWPYLIDIDTGWRGACFYFTAVYRDPRPDATQPVFRAHFARLKATGANSFTVSYMRHTGKFFDITRGVSLAEALEMIRDLPTFDQ